MPNYAPHTAVCLGLAPYWNRNFFDTNTLKRSLLRRSFDLMQKLGEVGTQQPIVIRLYAGSIF